MIRSRVLPVLAGLLLSPLALAQGGLDPVLQKGELRTQQAAQAQTRVDAAYDATRSALDEFKGVQKQIEGLKVYLEQLSAQVENQDRELAQIGTSIDNVALVERQIVPLMLRMIDALDQLVALDAPFLIDERKARVQRLRELMPRADVTVAEKFRNVMAAYSTEVNYGSTLEAYRGKLPDGREVDQLRIGRVALLYRSLDGSQRGYWDKAAKSWKDLPNSDDPDVLYALRVAREQTAPDLIHLPLATAEAAK